MAAFHAAPPGNFHNGRLSTVIDRSFYIRYFYKYYRLKNNEVKLKILIIH